MRAAAGLLALALAAPGCVSQEVADSAEDVLTLKTGTVNELRAQRGRGPKVRYALPPERMLEAAAQAARRMQDLAGRPITAVTISRRYGEVVAKERAPGAPEDPGYSYDWRSAVVVIVHPVPGDPGASDVEIHGTRRSPLLGHAVRWEQDLPPVLAQAVTEAQAAAEAQARERSAGAGAPEPTPAR